MWRMPSLRCVLKERELYVSWPEASSQFLGLRLPSTMSGPESSCPFSLVCHTDCDRLCNVKPTYLKKQTVYFLTLTEGFIGPLFLVLLDTVWFLKTFCII